VGQYSFLFLSEQLNFIIIFVPPEVPRSADFWAVPGMAQNGADFIFSALLLNKKRHDSVFSTNSKSCQNSQWLCRKSP
jgi:hypothetical protein